MSPLFDFSAPLHRVLRGLYAGCTLARAAYLDRPAVTTSVSAAIHAEGHTKLRFNSDLLPMVDIWRMREGVILVFEGTRASDADRSIFSRLLVQADNALQYELPGWPGRVGGYWGTMANALWPEIEPFIGQTGRRNTVIIGHSLGGSLALLTAHLIEAAVPGSVVGLMTFGMPRVGNDAFVVGSPFKHYRVFNRDDCVPDLPPVYGHVINFEPIWSLEPLSYSHHGTALSFDQHAVMYGCDETPFFNREGVSPLGALGTTLSLFGVHQTHEYLRRLRWQFWLNVSDEVSALDDLNNALNIEDGAMWRVEHLPGFIRYESWDPASL